MTSYDNVNITTLGGDSIPESVTLELPLNKNIIENIECGEILVDFLDEDGNLLDLSKSTFMSYISE